MRTDPNTWLDDDYYDVDYYDPTELRETEHYELPNEFGETF